MKPDADNKKRKGLPQNIPPTLARRGFCVMVPDDPEYIASFRGALYDLTDQYRWDRDELNSAQAVANVWKGVFIQLSASMALGENCYPVSIPEEGCSDYLPNNPRFAYAPNDPFSTPNLVPPGYTLPPFYTNPLIPLPGVQPTDAMVNFLALPVAMTLPEFFAVGYPRIIIPIEGTGEVEIELVRVLQGGIAVLVADDDYSTSKVVDLNSVTLVGLPGLEDILDVVLENNLSEVEIVEFHFETPGEHKIEIQFWPNFGGDVLIGFGGGLRQVTYCADALAGDVPMPEFRVDGCNLEWRPNSESAWEFLADVCCDCEGNEMFDIRVVDCVLEKTTDGINWTTVIDLHDCSTGEPGQTPEFRMRTVSPEQKAIEWKYTDEADIPANWRTVGYVVNGEDGINAGEQVWRLVTESATRRVLQWRFEAEPDVPGTWRTVGAWNIPLQVSGGGDCDCDPVIAPTEITETPDRCDVAFGIVNRAIDEITQEVIAYDAAMAWPPIEARALFYALDFLRHQSLPLTAWGEIKDYMVNQWATIDDSSESVTFRSELADSTNLDLMTEIVYSVYNPAFQFTVVHAALIATAALINYPTNRAIQAMAQYILVTPVSRWQEAAIEGMTQFAGQDCSGFTPVAGAVAREVNFVDATGSIYETVATYTTNVRLSLLSGALTEPLRVYYEAQDLTAVNQEDFYLPFGYVTFPIGATDGTLRPIAFPIIDNDIADGNRQFRISLMETDGDTIIGAAASHTVTIKDNEDFFLIINTNGTGLQRVGTWTWQATSTQGANNFQRLGLAAMNMDHGRCFKVKSLTVIAGTVNDHFYYRCNDAGTGATQPPDYIDIWSYDLAYAVANQPPFTIEIEIEPA